MRPPRCHYRPRTGATSMAYCASLIFARTHRALTGAGLVELQDKLPEEQ